MNFAASAGTDASTGETGGRGGTMTVPVAALAVPGEDNAPSTPQVGDRVSYQVDGVVESVNGDQAEVRASAINGQPVEDMGSAGTDAATGDGQREALLAQMGGGL